MRQEIFAREEVLAITVDTQGSTLCRRHEDCGSRETFIHSMLERHRELEVNVGVSSAPPGPWQLSHPESSRCTLREATLLECGFLITSSKYRKGRFCKPRCRRNSFHHLALQRSMVAARDQSPLPRVERGSAHV